MNRDTVGKISLALSEKQPETRDPIEIEREVHKDYEKHINDCIQRHKNTIDGNFYVEVITKKERLMPNVLRNYFFATQACPTPTWDQTIYKYHRSQDIIEFLWVVPSKDTVELFLQNALQIADNEKELLQFILKFTDGSLLKLAKKLNGEVEDSPFLDN